MPSRKGRCAFARGVTLFEVLIVVAIMALVSAGVAIAALSFWKEALIKDAQTNARTVRGAVEISLQLDPHGCPSVEELIKAKRLNRDSPTVDPWGKT